MSERSNQQQAADSDDLKTLTVRHGILASAAMICGHFFGLLRPSTFFARDEQTGPALYRATLPIRVLVYPVSFIALPVLAITLTLLAWLVVALFAPVIWIRARTLSNRAAAGR